MPDTGNYAPTPGVGATFTALAEAAALLAQSRINTMMPATVVAWRAPTGAPPARKPAVVDVLPDFLYRRRINTAADVTPGETPLQRANGWEAVGAYPTFTSVPVAYPGTDGMRVSGPILPGASGWLFFAQRSIDDWMDNGGPVDPAFDFQWHHFSDAVFVPGARYGAIAEDVDPLVHRIGSADGGAGMEIDELPIASRTITVSTQGPTATVDAATNVKLGASAVLGVARLTDTTASDVQMTAWMVAAQPLLTTIAALAGAPVPVYPGDFGIIDSASAKVLSE